jgi:2-polyprenyl-3-methyl-5-hydroxy-6-metoxy-1,4-benzoquinol methylase
VWTVAHTGRTFRRGVNEKNAYPGLTSWHRSAVRSRIPGTMKRQKREKEWFDDDDFWRETFSYVFAEKRQALASEVVDKALTLTKLEGKSALDLGCGIGSFSIALAERGFSVTGVDRTKYLLDKARAKARSMDITVEWVQKDMRDFVRPEAYDFVLSMFSSFGYFDDRAEDAAVLRNIFESLRPGGVFLIDVLGKEILAKVFQTSSAQTLPDGSMLVEQRKILDGWTRVQNEWTVIRKGRSRNFTLQLNIYSGQELRQEMELAGLVDVKLYGNLDGDPYGPDAKRLIAVGSKPKMNRRFR